MGYVIAREAGHDPEAAGVTIIEAHGIAHRIEFRVDHINNQPKDHPHEHAVRTS